MIKIILKGVFTGLVLQLAIGPVFFFIVNLAIQSTIWNGLAAAAGVALGDLFYITLAILGVGKLIEKNKIKKVFAAVSSVVLILFGIMVIVKALSGINSDAINSFPSLVNSFASVLFLTLTSPLTVVLFTSVFASIAVAKDYRKQELYLFGFGTGLATFIFMASAVLIFSLIKEAFPFMLVKTLNLGVGALLIGYGGIRFFKSLFESQLIN